MKLVSIVVPVYNAAPYLKACVDSLLSQTYPETEILLVDNHSTDNSLSLCRDYEQREPCITCYALPENGGPSVARNFGMRHARGEYLGFCDADDTVLPTMYEDLVNRMEADGSDYVVADMYGERIGRNLGLPWPDGTVFDRDGIREQMVPLYVGNRSDNDTTIPVWGSVVKCLFCRDLVAEHQLRFPEEFSFAEDLVFTLRYLAVAGKASVRNYPYYYYRYHADSLMNNSQRYKPDMTDKRLHLLQTVSGLLEDMHIRAETDDRLNTTARAYFHECVGNACLNGAEKRSFSVCLQEVRSILALPLCRTVFCRFDAANPKRRLLYSLMRRRCACLLTLYYRLRVRS